MSSHSGFVVLEKIPDCSMLTNLSEGDARMDSMEDRVFGFPALLGVSLFEVKIEM